MKNKIAVNVIVFLFILLFAYTAFSKLTGMFSFQFALRESPLLGNYYLPVSWAVPFSELIICLLLAVPRYRLRGLYYATALMLLFTIYIVCMIALIPTLPCSCGGVIKLMSWRQHVLFNSFFITLGLCGIILEKNQYIVFYHRKYN